MEIGRISAIRLIDETRYALRQIYAGNNEALYFAYPIACFGDRKAHFYLPNDLVFRHYPKSTVHMFVLDLIFVN